MHGKSLESSSSPRIMGEQCPVAVESTLWSTGGYGTGRGSHPGSPLALRGSHRHLVAPVDGVVVAVESTVLRASPGGAPRVLLAGSYSGQGSYRIRGSCPRSPRILRRRKVRGVGSIVAGTASGMSAQGVTGSHRVGTAPGMAAQ